MKKIYCVYCGEENKSTDTKCVKCNKKLNPKEHPFREYLYNHIKDDLKGNVEDKLMSLIINFIKSHLYGSIVTVLLITLVVGNIVFNDGITNVNSKYSLSKEGYNLVRILYYSQCSSEGSLYGTEVYQIKTGDKLGNYYDKWNNKLGEYNGYVTLETFNKRLEITKQIQKLQEECYDKYPNDYRKADECVKNIDSEYLDFEYLYEPEITSESIIDKDYIFVTEGGCGEAITEEDIIVGTWSSNEDKYYIFDYDYTGLVAIKKSGRWQYSRFLWEYYDGIISFTDSKNSSKVVELEIEIDDYDDWNKFKIKNTILERIDDIPYNIEEMSEVGLKDILK